MTAADGESAGSDFIEVEAPDGSVVEFPKDTAPDVMARAMRRTYGLSETGRRARSVRERGILAEREAQSRRSPMPSFDEMGQPTVPEPPAQAAVIPEPAPFVAQDERTTAGAMGRQVARGAIETAGLVPKGAAALGARLDYNEQDIAGTTDRYAAANPQERAQMRREVLGQFRDSPGTRDSLMSRFSDIDEGVAVPRPQPVTPIEQRQTFKAGEAIDEYGRTRFPTTKAEDEAFWTGQVPRALGSTVAMAPVALAGAPFGALGRLLAGVGLATTGAGEATQNAVDRRRGLEDMVRAGDAPSPDAYPTDRQIATAAGQGLAPGALDAAAIDNLLRPVVRVPGFRGLIAAVAKKAIEQGIVEGTTEGVQQVMQNLIAQHGYNPDQGVLDQVAENVLVGGAVGVLTGGLAGGMIRPRRGDPRTPLTADPATQPIPQQEIPPNVSRETIGATDATPSAPNPGSDQRTPISADPGLAKNAAGISAPSPEDLQAVLDDPRPVAEIMAERERQAQRQATIAAVEQEDGPDAAAAVAKVMDGAGQRRTPMQAETAADVDMAAAQAQQPTPAQAEAGNYRKGHVSIQGLDIAIEVARGGERTGVGPDGRPWSVTMPAHYGYLKAGKDSGDGKVDVFVGDLPDAPYVYVIDQIDPDTGKFDEPKVMMGMGSQTEAGAFYDASYSDGSGPARMGAITRLTVAELKAWLRDGNPKKPLAYVPGPPVAAPAADAWASDPIVQAAPAAVPNTPPPFSESRPASTVPLGGQTAAPPSAGFPSPGPMPMAVAPQDPLAQAQAYAESIKTTLSDAEMVDVRDLVAEGVDPEEAVEIALTRSGLDMADEIVAATEEAPDEVPTQAEAEPARAPGAVPAQEGPREEPADARAEAGSAPQGEQPRGAEQSAPAAESVAQGAPAPKDAIDSALDTALDEQFGAKQEAAPRAKRERSSTPRAPRSAGQAATSAAKNTAAGLGEATTALVRLFGAKPNRLTSGIGFDEDTYREARPHFVAALRHFQAAARDIAEAARALVRHLAANGLDRAGIEAMRPYLSRFLGEVRDGGVDLDPATIQAEASPKENGDGNGRAGTLEGAGTSPLGEVAAEPGARAESGEDAGQGTERRGEDDARGNAELDEGGSDPRRGVGSDAKSASVPAAGERRPKLSDADKAAEQRSDHEIEASDAIGDGGQIKKYNDNIVAIRLLKDLERAGVPANVEQKKLLARYVGWGGIKSAFPGRDENNRERWNKGWEERGKALRDLLTPDEYDAARRSILNAHYTSETVVRAMYDMVARLGFTGGSVLEPSMGTGNFFGMMPRALRGTTRRTGVELDAITGGIAKHLYSESNILAPMGFQEAPLADNHFDMAIGNPPFGAEPVPGAKEEYRRFSIHNYFFARTIDKVRPGGLMMMIVTSRYLDTRGRDQRNYVADRAELVGAIRLPNTAFQKNAGTEVTTDILIFRKLPESARGTADKSWMETDTIPDPLGGEPIEISAYFKANPEMMLGRMERSGTMYAKGEPTLAPDGRDLGEALRGAVARLPEGIYQPSTIDVPALVAAAGEGPKASEAASDYDVGSYFIDGDAVFRRDASPDGSVVATKLTAETPWTEKQTLGETRLARIRGLVRVRDAARQVLSLEASDAPDAKVDKARADLNDAYDQFVSDHGFVSERANETIFAADPDAPLLLALESDFDPGVTRSRAKSIGVEFRKPRATKASIFTSRVIPRYTPIIHAENATDALAASLADKAGVDLAHMAALTGKSEQSIIADLHDDRDEPLIFRDPSLDRWVTTDEYLSGNVKRKAAQAKAAGLDKNLAALKAVFPKDLTAGEIRARIGAPWIKPQYYVAFAKHLLGDGTEGSVVYLPATGGFSARFSAGDNLSDVERWGTHRLGGADLLERLMNQREIIVRDRQPDDSTVINREETDKAVAKAQAIRDEWESWLMRDADRREDLVAYYNANYNTDVAPKFDGSHMTLPGKTPTIKLRRHQINAVWRGVLARTVLLDHVVGAGKTFTMIAQAMEMRRIGLARKPMLVVPNHLVQQWATDFYRLYPGAKILAMGRADFEKSNRKRMLARIATGNWDAVITAHSTFGFMGVSPETEASFIQQQIDELDATISAVMAQNGNKKNRSASQLEKQKQRLEAKLAELLERPRDELLTFEQIGVDQLFVDEAHEFKNLFFSTARRGLLGLGNPQGSKKAFDMFVKVRYLLGKQAGKGVVFATGTPVSNSLSELYTLQRYLGLENLRDRGIHSFDGWMNAFGVDEAKHEIDSTGNRYKQVTRLRRLTNVGEIIAFYRQFADSVTLDHIKTAFAEDNPGKEFPIPKVKGGGRQGLVVKRSEAQARYFAALVKRAEKLKNAGRPEKGADNMLSITSDARKAALDMRLVYPGASDNPDGKTTVAAGRIFDIWKRSAKDSGTQLVFLDLSTPAKQARKEGPKAIKAAIEAAGDPQTPAGFASLPLDEQWVWARDKVYETLNREGDDDAADKAREKAQRFIDNEMAEAEAAVTTAATGFSVYDDMRAKLIERGVPEAEIAFIHDYGTDDRKADLFDQVNAGRIRILFGSTAKMGAGTNVQRRIVALHHIDTPWRPSDIEQREGRAIRQGNELLAKHGKDFEIEILSYATELTYDARMWGVQEGKIIAIDSLRRYSGQREIEEVSPEAASAAELKAAASGNPLILEDVQLTEKVNKLGAERRAHERSQWDLEDRQRRNQRIIDDAERLEAFGADAKTAREYLDGIAEAVRTKGTIAGKTYETFAAARDAAQAAIAEQKGGSERAAWSLDVNGKKITSQEALATALTDTWGDASAFRVEIDGKSYISRRLAARKIHQGEAKSEASGTIGGFKFTIEIEANRQGVINPWTRSASIELVGKTTHAEAIDRSGKEKVDGDTMAVAALRRLDDMITGIGPAYEDRTKAVEKARAEQSEIQGMLGKPWAKAEELAKAQERLTEVRRLLTETEKKDETEAKDEDEADDTRYQMAPADRASLRVAGEIDATVNLTPKDAAQRDAVANALKITLRRMVGKAAPDTAVFDSMMVGEQEITGAYSPLNNLLAVSLRSPDPIGTVRHETIHVLRQLGLIDEAAWSALTQAAETGGWLDKHAIDERWGDGLTREQALEEAIAEEFGVGLREGVWKTGNARADAIFQRLAEFFRRVRAEIKRALAATGLRDMTDADVAELVFSLIERGAFREGEITARTRQGAMAQTAWHGTPHTFDRFSTEKIGTGEGAQAYGYGLYFAGKKEVAEHYRDMLSLDPREGVNRIVANLVKWESDIANTDDVMFEMRRHTALRPFQNDSVIKRLILTAVHESNRDGTLTNAGLAALKELDRLLPQAKGRLYAVELAPAEDEYLLWDKPLSEQSEKVKSALRRAQAANESVFSESMDGDVVDTFAALRSGDDSGGAFYKDIAAEMGAFETSAALHAAGIRGIKYLDGSSRNIEVSRIDMPDGSKRWEVIHVNRDKALGEFATKEEAEDFANTKRNFNYVIFDDKDVSITTMYQMAAAGAQQAASTPQPRKMRALRAAISALRGGDVVDPLAKVRVPNDIGWARKTMVTPRTIAAYFPGFADAFFRGVDQSRTRDMSISELTEIARPYLDLDEAGKEKVNKVVEHGRMAGEVYSPRERDGKIIVKNKVGQQIRGKIGGVTLMADGETVTLDAKEVDAYRAYRKVMDRALDKFRDQVLREWGFDPNAADAPTTADAVDELARNTENAGERARLKTLSTVLSSIEMAKRRGYAPFTRYGSHYVTVTTMQDGRSAVVHREHIEPGLTTSPRTKLTRARLEQEAARLRARLADIYPPNRGFEISELREVTPASFDDIPDFSDLDAIIQAANLAPDQAAAVQQALGEVIQKRGFRAHFIKSRNIPGYSVDFERSLADYIVGISGYLARREYLPQIEDAIASLPATQPELRRYAKEWNDYIQNPSEEWNGLRQAGFLWYLSGRLSSALVNLSQVPMVTAPYLSMFAGTAQGSAEIARAYKDAGLAIRPKPKSMGGAGLDFFDPNALPADVREAVKRAIADGTLLPIETFQEMARAQGKTPKSRSMAAKAKAAQDAAAFMFQAAERTNRLVSFISAYRLAQRPEVMGRVRADLRDNPLWTRRTKERRQDAATFAAFVVEETQFLLGKVNRTRMMRGPGAVIFQFKAFAANYIELMARMGAFGSGVHRGGHRYAALASMMFAMFLVGGLMGLPGAEDGFDMIEALIKAATGIDPQFERRLRESAGSLAAMAAGALGASEETQAGVSAFSGRVAARGLARESGVDVSQRIGMGRVAPKPTGTEHDDFWYRAIGLAGIPGSWVLRGIDIGLAAGRGDWWQAGIRAAPEAAADLMRARQLSTEGVKTIAKGRQVIMPDERLPDGTLAGGASNVTKRALGFQPTGISRAREQMNAVRRASEAPRDLFADFNLRRANIQAAINRASETLEKAQSDAQRATAEVAIKRETQRLDAVMREIEKYNDSAPDERRYKIANPGFAQQLKVANQGQRATQIKKVPMRARGSIEDIQARY